MQDDDSSNENRNINGGTTTAINDLADANKSNESQDNFDDSSSLDGNDIDDETISGENDVEYAEFSMAHLMPNQNDISRNTSAGAVGGDASTINGELTDTSALDEELMLLSIFDDSSSNSGAIQDAASSHSSNNYSFSV